MASDASAQLSQRIDKLNRGTLQSLIRTVERNPPQPLVDFFRDEGDRYTRALRKLSSALNVPDVGASENSSFIRASTFSTPSVSEERIDALIQAINQRCVDEEDHESPAFTYRESTGQQLMSLIPHDNDARIHFLDDLVAKRVRRDLVTIEEAANMQQIRHLTSIPVPHVVRVHAHLHDVYIFMSCIPGVNLEDVWPTMTSVAKKRIIEQLKKMMANLRSVPPPSPCYFGSLESHICLDARLITRVTVGLDLPITSEAEFNQFIMTDLKTRFHDEYYHMLLSMARQDHKVLLTHADFHPRNIRVQGDNVTGIIDWQYAGWYPEHWEYVKALLVVGRIVDWWRYLPDIIGPYYSEWAIDRQIQHVMKMR
jgi:aminoglycoside phosphotransferase